MLSCIVAQGSVNAMEKFPLHRAVVQGDVELVEALLLSNNNADINQKDNDGCAPLHLAARIGREAIVEFLLNNGANANLQDKDGWTPLYSAACHGREAIVKLLLANGADVNLKDNSGKTPLQIATRKDYQGIVQIITEHIKSQRLAFAMGLHQRLGENSPINILPGDGSVFEVIRKYAFSKDNQ